MIVFPAIDVKDGKCVRLFQGDLETAVVFHENPADQARNFEGLGFSWLHIVDLNGAVAGQSVNTPVVEAILKRVALPIQLGGGIRTEADIDRWLAAGIARVILGTVAVKDPDLVKRAAKKHRGRIAVGIDARNGRVAVDGWTRSGMIEAVELGKRFEDAGVAAIIYTDIARDGTGLGLNLNETLSMADAVAIPLIASGGVGSLDDLRLLRDAGHANIDGVIVGRAFYDGSIDPHAALALARD